MNPESPQLPRDEMEQRLTALLLGELSAEESAALHRAMEQDGELAKLFARLHHTVGLVREAMVKPGEFKSEPVAPAKLSTARREKLLTHFKTITPQEFGPAKRRGQIRLLEVAAVLAICALLAAMLLPALSKSKSKAQSVAVQSNVRQIEVAKQLWADENKKSAGDAPTMEELKPYLGRSEMPSVRGETYVIGRVGEPVVADYAKTSAAKAPAETDAQVRTALSAAEARRGAELAFRTWSGDSGARAKAGYDANRSGLADLAEVEFYYADADVDKSKRPVGVTPLKGQPVTPTAIPNPVVNYVATDGDVGIGGKNQTHQRDGASGWSEVVLPPVEQPAAGGAISRYAYVADGNVPKQNVADFGVVAGAAPVESVTLGTEFSASTATGVAGEVMTDGLEAGQRYYRNIPGGVTGSAGGGGGAGGGGLPVIVATDSFADRSGEGVDLYRKLGVDQSRVEGQSVLSDLGAGDLTVRGTAAESEHLSQINEVLAAKPSEASLKAKFAEVAQNDDRALGYDWYLGNKVANDKSELATPTSPAAAPIGSPTDQWLNEGKITTISGRASGNVLDASLALDLPSVPDGGRIAPESNVSSFDIVGSVNGPARRQRSSVVLPGAVVAATPRPPLTPADAKKSLSDEALDGRVQANGTLLARADQSESGQNRAYQEKRRELQEMTEFDRLLKRKMAVEKADLSLPKSAQVEIIENADAKAAPPTGFLGKMRGALSSDVERVASIKTERDKSDIDELSAASTRFNPYDSYFVMTDAEVIQSEVVLGKVVEKLKLDEAWARQKGVGGKLKTPEAVALLKERLELRPRPNTTIMDIRAKSSKPEEAAQIANAVAAAYKEWRFERGQRLVTKGIVELEKQARLHEEKIGQVRAELDTLRGDLKISDAEAAAELDVAAIRKPATNAPIPHPEILTSENNFSTFSLNVSDVSFKLAAASLEKGQMPDVASIRSEEFINAFDYRDPEPQAGAPIAFAYERARYPFAHNRDLLRFSLKTAAAGRQAGRPLNIVLLLDNSGSMERADRVHTIREALRVLAGQLQAQDKLSVITFARTARLVADGASGNEAEAVALTVSEITPQGGTNLEDAMNLAYQTAAKHYLANGINRVVLLTDGAANLGDVEPESLKQKVEAQRKQGIALDCFGIGWEGLNDDLLEVLSRNGDGRYGFINSPEEAATDFVGQLAGALKVAASDVKVQVEFNPKRVMSYRQVGYAKHQLTKEQFRDNTVDAAEIAAREAGNALYTVEVNAGGAGPIGTVRVRYKVPGTTTYREQAWDVPYTGNALSLEQSSPAMRLAASASAFAEWLVASPFAGEITPDRVLGYLSGVPEVYGADARPKKLEWMIRQAKSLEGK